MPPVQRPGHRSRFWLALAAAVLLHALLAITVSFVSPPRAAQCTRPQHTVLSVELREAPRANRAPAIPPPAVAPSAPPSSAESSAQRVAVRRSEAKKSGEAGGAAEAAGDVGNAEGLAIPERPKSQWAPGWGVSLHLHDAAGALGIKGSPAEALPGPVRVPSRAEALAEEQVRVQTKVEGWVLDDAAHIRVQGARDAYWQVVQDALEKNFKVDWSVIDKDVRKPGLAGMADAAAQDWKREAAAYGATGGLGGGANAPGAPRGLQQEFTQLAASERGFRSDSPLANPLLPQVTLGAGSGGAFTSRLVVQILITQRADGSVTTVEVRVPSGNGLFDRIALDRARALGKDGTLGLPPRGHFRSLWSFETDFTQLPPLPFAGCALDAYFIPRECFYPLKKTVKSRLKLEALY